VVECTALEMRRAWKGTVGSNPTLSATTLEKTAAAKPAGRSGRRSNGNVKSCRGLTALIALPGDGESCLDVAAE
jgi:hypothetical protein